MEYDLYIGDINRQIVYQKLNKDSTMVEYLSIISVKKDAILVKIEGNGYIELDDFVEQKYRIIPDIPFSTCTYVEKTSLKKYKTTRIKFNYKEHKNQVLVKN